MLLLIVAFSLATTAVNIEQNGSDRQESENPASCGEYAQISCYLYEGEGCGCVPVRFVLVSARGIDTAHNDSGLTDENGLCILELEYDYTYRITIEVENFEMILFDFNVLDDQTFTFHLQEKDDSVLPHFPVVNKLVQRLQMIENVIS